MIFYQKPLILAMLNHVYRAMTLYHRVESLRDFSERALLFVRRTTQNPYSQNISTTLR